MRLLATGPPSSIGYEPKINLFAGFDLRRHRSFTTGSPSVQIDIEELRKAETDGLSFHRKSNDEIAVGFRPDMFMAYAMNAIVLHRYGRQANVLRLLKEAVHAPRLPQQEIETMPTERQRVIMEVNRLTREAGFRQRVLFAYGNRCAVTRVQLRLEDAAHILPVGAPGSVDHVRNGVRPLANVSSRVRRWSYIFGRPVSYEGKRPPNPCSRTVEPRRRRGAV